jgi:hypothetical protein
VSEGISDDVQQFITAHVDSVEKLEILLLLHGERDATWTADRVSRAIRRNVASVDRCLKQLASAKLLEGSGEGGYLFGPPNRAVAAQVDRVAETHAARRVAVVELIVSNPMDAVTSFADAFRFRGKR